MGDSSETPASPKAEEFFASEAGVCVYVNIRGRAFRVLFESPEGPTTASGTSDVGADEAIAIATEVLSKHRAQLEPLFERVRVERASRNP